MDNNYTVSSLLPFINEEEVSYYADLKTEKLMRIPWNGFRFWKV